MSAPTNEEQQKRITALELRVEKLEKSCLRGWLVAAGVIFGLLAVAGELAFVLPRVSGRAFVAWHGITAGAVVAIIFIVARSDNAD